MTICSAVLHANMVFESSGCFSEGPSVLRLTPAASLFEERCLKFGDIWSGVGAYKVEWV